MPRKKPEPIPVPYVGWTFQKAEASAPIGPLSPEIGVTGLVRYGKDVAEEWHHALRGRKGAKIYREMSDNDSTVGSSLYAISSLVRQVRWRMDPAPDHPLAEEAATFATECIEDMSHTWADFLGEIMSMAVQGWVYFERCYKIRDGKGDDPTRKSRYTDGKMGWRKFAIRAQETLDGWDFDEEGGIRGMFQMAPPTYRRVLIPIEKALLFRPQLAKNNPEGRSMLRNAYRSWFFLKRLEELEAIMIEREGTGLGRMELPISYFDANAPIEKKNAVANYAKMVSQVRRNEHEGLVLPAELDKEGKPTGFKFSLVTSGGTRSLDVTTAIGRHQKAIGQVLLTQFIFLGMDKVGSNALSMDMTSLFSTALGALLDTIEETFHRFAMMPLMELNGYPPEACPRWAHGDVEQVNIAPIADSLLKLVNAGLITPDSTLEDYLRAEARLPEKNEDDPEPNPASPIPSVEDSVIVDAPAVEQAAQVNQLASAAAQAKAMGDLEMADLLRNKIALVLGVEDLAPLPRPS